MEAKVVKIPKRIYLTIPDNAVALFNLRDDTSIGTHERARSQFRTAYFQVYQVGISHHHTNNVIILNLKKFQSNK